MPEYIYPDDELDIDENEVFVGFIRKNCEQLIRCKDCKYWGADGYRYGCKYATGVMIENDYCSRAERKEE